MFEHVIVIPSLIECAAICRIAKAIREVKLSEFIHQEELRVRLAAYMEIIAKPVGFTHRHPDSIQFNFSVII
jgi:hypothetical protein